MVLLFADFLYRCSRSSADTDQPAPTAGEGATCKSCAHCPWMAMNELNTLAECLRDDRVMAENEIWVDPEIGERAMVPLNRMLDFKY